MHFLRSILLFLLFLSYGSGAKAQGLSVTGVVGYGVPVLDEGGGIHLGINPFYNLGNLLAIEGQVSYARLKVSSSFLTGNQNIDNSFNLLVGPRLYFTSPAREVRPYINALFGFNRFVTERTNQDNVEDNVLGVSLGVYASIRQFVVGLALETDGMFVLKGGYTFE